MKEAEKLRTIAIRNEKNRNDFRFLDTMGLLVAKGMLGYNRPILLKPNAKLFVIDAIWAGKNVEPRILEVLPAMFVRLKRHFIISERPNGDELELLCAAESLKLGLKDSVTFIGIPYKKLSPWMELPLLDGRTCVHSEKKQLKAFRLHPLTIEILRKKAKATQKSEAEIIEDLVRSHLSVLAVI